MLTIRLVHLEGLTSVVDPLPIDRVPIRSTPPISPRDRHHAGASLPNSPTTLVGRAGEVREVVALLRRADVRLLTLTGPGGVGKTRLALAIAKRLASEFRDGVVFVDLAPVHDPNLVMVAIAQTLGLREMPGHSPRETLVAALVDRHVLLVLDNVEHVIAAAPAIAALVAVGPKLTVLATSRSPLNVRAERAYPVGPLPVPDPGPASIATVTGNPAVGLFVERAQAAVPSFTLTDLNAVTLAEICRRLDGLPLAIELAAARLTVLPLPGLLTRISNRLALLTAGAQDHPERLRTIRTTIAWSHDLLAAEEQTLFRRLAVFAGGFTLASAEVVMPVASDPGIDILEGIASLVEKSLLVRRQDHDGEPRFGMLETIREYALERLAESGEETTVHRAHALAYRDIAERAEAGFFAGADLPWLDIQEMEHDNFRAALAWSLDHAEVETAQRFGALGPFWFIRGHLTEGRAWFERILALDTRSVTAARAAALFGAGQIARGQGDVAAATALHEEALAIRRSTGDEAGIATSLFMLGDLAIEAADDDRATALHTEALARCRGVGGLDFCVAAALWQLGTIAARRDAQDEAMAAYTEALGVSRGTGGRWVASFVLESLGRAALARGDPARAIELFRESVLSCWEIGDRWALAYALVGLAEAVVVERGFERAARLFGAAEALREAGNMPLMRFTRSGYEQALHAIRTNLDEARRTAAWDAGRHLPLARVVQDVADLAPIVMSPALAAPYPGGLTEREGEVLRLLATGLSNAAIAERLFLSRRTIDAHLTHIYAKLDVKSRAAATRVALDHGLA